jgi:FkbM family methyltransferase
MPPVAAETFVSYAQNGEDVLLWRALGHVKNGRYVDVGAWDADEHSVTKAFYDRGWRGIDIEPIPELAEALREARPEDEVVQAAVALTEGAEVTLHRIRQPGTAREATGLSTLIDDIASGHAHDGRFEVDDIKVETRTLASICGSRRLGGVIHFLKIDVEGAEADVLRSMDFATCRPWVVLVEATKPLSVEPSHEEWEHLLLDAGYEFCVFDGLSRFYVAAEHPELKADLSYPVCVFDEYTRPGELSMRQSLEDQRAERARLWDDLVQWRALALDAWSDGFGRMAALEDREVRLRGRLRRRARQIRRLERELNSMQGSISWRVTKPLRWVRSRLAFRGRSGKVTGR